MNGRNECTDKPYATDRTWPRVQMDEDQRILDRVGRKNENR